jgi:3-phenylpropionate/trans-cinnamate dioxygenase ferredoxin reductase subunit
VQRIVVAGAGMAGSRTCEELRRSGFTGELTLVGAEPHDPYDRPPLSKDVLKGEIDSTRLPVDYGELGVEVLASRSATALRPDAGVVETTAGPLAYDGLVLATGATPVRLPGPGEQLTLRSVDDALALRARLVPGARIVVVGASWIGAEVATVALGRGCQVTCVEAGPAPLSVALGPDVGSRTLPWWEGIDLRLGVGVDEVVDGGIELSDGERLGADAVVVGVGVRPTTGWLESSGVLLERGVVVDERLRTSLPGVVAVGDVAAWWSRRFATRLRVEHWDDAYTSPAVAAATLLCPDGDDADDAHNAPLHDPVPYFWSHQFGNNLQYVGHRGDASRLVWRIDPEGRAWGVGWVDADGRLAAFLSANRPRDMIQARRLIADSVVPDLDRLADPAVPVRDSVASG